MRSFTILCVLSTLILFVGCDYLLYEDAGEVTEYDLLERRIFSLTFDEDNGLSPSDVVFQNGMLYTLEICNAGIAAAKISGKDFFQAVTVFRLESVDGELQDPHFQSLYIYPGRSLDITFLPKRKGVFEMRSSVEGGEIIVFTNDFIIK